MKRITIISLMEGFSWGGSEELWFNTALHALNAGCKVQVCIREWNEAQPKINMLRDKGAIILKRKSGNDGGMLQRLFGPKEVTKNYLADVRKFDPDAVLVSQGATFDVFRKPELVDFLEQSGKTFSLISQFNFEDAKPLEPAAVAAVQRLKNKWRKFYFVSERNRTKAVEQAGFDLPETAIADNPVNMTDTSELAWPVGDALRLACIARYQFAFKGQDTLVQTLAKDEFKAINYTLDFYGKGPDEQRLKELIVRQGLQDKIFVRGHVSDVREVWRDHHVMLLPSLSEGTPLTLQEAMITGRPALANPVGDCARLVIPGVTGFLCTSTSAGDLHAQLQLLFSTSPEALRTMGKEARAHVLKTINLDSAGVIFRELL